MASCCRPSSAIFYLLLGDGLPHTAAIHGALWLGARLRGVVSARSRCAFPDAPEQPMNASTQQSDRQGEEVSTAERPRGEFSQSEVSTAELDREPLSSEERHTVEVPLDELFTAEQRATLLRTFNEASGAELGAMRALRGRKGANVAAFRDEHGPFGDLDSLTRVPYLKYKSLFKACTVLLQPKLSREAAARQSKRLTFLKPDVSRESLETVRSVVSLVFGMHRVAWAHVTRSLDVLAWQQRRCDTIRTGSYAPNVYYEELRATVALIPKADLYVLERPSLPPGNTSLFPVVLHLRSMETTLFSLLSLRDAAAAGTEVADNPWMEPPTTVPPPHPRVLGMSRSAVGQHFQLMLGSTKTSGREVVRLLLDEVLLLERPRVRVPRSLASARDSRECEEMCDALLQALAFLELALGPAN
ncbi:transcription elongation factor, mitochondrial isoform X1 [Petromyzon marinus]|uniref:transcription elongation factor, mitochondrial isoform X1 n=1 Tax=Petromyzon marinus TaxID=7757 RepID=UPI003F72FAAE